ncbi:hypothetical protein [Candidatus Borrarchaeum sp.]|uniref:hypothetical protein n=1 Tax=Candidatus Borrarchaeum sp. TaxID=2846742 RepID=UPI00257B2897|nr:hypothetical protein [Candidatus Borrarchaeum sp.]
MSFEVNFNRVTQNLNTVILSEERNLLQEIAKPQILKSLRISENKLLRLVLKDQKYFIELIASGYKVTQLAAGKTTLQEAEKCYVELLHKIKNGGSMLEPY